MVIEKSRNRTHIETYLNGCALKQVKNYKDLGITFNENGSLTDAQHILLKHVRRNESLLLYVKYVLLCKEN